MFYKFEEAAWAAIIVGKVLIKAPHHSSEKDSALIASIPTMLTF